jgi:NhaP-type Na+/H+ or K+/H+ antiporter
LRAALAQLRIDDLFRLRLTVLARGRQTRADAVNEERLPGIIPLLTWSGLRGGISVAMVLSLPQFAAKDFVLACTYAVVVFSIIVQGLTTRRVLTHYGVGQQS